MPDQESTSIGEQMLKIRGRTLPTRYGLAPFNSGLFQESGDPAPACLPFYESFCNSRLGFLTIGGVAVSREGRANRHALALTPDVRTDGLASVVDLAHGRGIPVAIQIEHAGRQTSYAETGLPCVAASAIPCPVVGVKPRELTGAEVRTIVDQFVSVASRLATAGADFVELHAAHGYLLSGFLSQTTNHRNDVYGGTLENRFRILRDILDRLEGLAVGIRVNGFEADGGLLVQEVVSGLAPVRSQIAYVSVSAGMYTTAQDLIMPSRRLGQALWREQSRQVREELGVPVFLAGNILDTDMADAILQSGDADMILFGRALLSDPNMLTGVHQPCTDCRLCKYHTRGFPTIYCPFHPVLRDLKYPKRRAAAC